MSSPSPSATLNNAFVTLLTSPSYLPGVLVLLHALHALHPAPRDFKIVCLVTPETVDARTIGEVRKAGYDLVIGVEGISSGAEGQKGLDLMGRPDLNLALTKLHIFRLSPLFNTIIYLDADVLPLRPLDHLFTSTAPHVLSACSDTGWPDCFNSGVLVVRPRDEDFEGMRGILAASAEASTGEGGNGSFDGADQGLFNEWFSEEGGGGGWNRLSFTYNVTPSAAYQYAPAYKRYGHKISAVHFIGKNKPWSNIQYRPAGISNVVGGPKEGAFDYSSLLDRWYSIYDAHVRPTSAHSALTTTAHSTPSSRFTVPPNQAIWNSASTAPQQPSDRMDLDALKAAASLGYTGHAGAATIGAYTSLPLDGRVDLLMPIPGKVPGGKRLGKKVSFGSTTTSGSATPTKSPSPPHQQQSPPHQPEVSSQSAAWDAQSHSPPKKGLPEMAHAQIEYYKNAWDQPTSTQSSYFSTSSPNTTNNNGRPTAEPQYPTLPSSVVNDSWYSQFTSGPAPNSGAVGNVFPWEGKGEIRRADRVFPRGSTPPPSGSGHGQGHNPRPSVSVQLPTPPAGSNPNQSPAYSPPANPNQPQSLSEAMASYRNAWDTDPSIARYISKITGSAASSTPSDVQKGLASVPQTPRLTPEEMNERRLGHGVGEARSDGSGDGDDEDDGDDEEEESAGGLRLRKRGGAKPRSDSNSGGNVNPRYRDRHAQTDKMETTDQGGQHPQAKDGSGKPGTAEGGYQDGIVPGLNLGFAGGGLRVPSPSLKLEYTEDGEGQRRSSESSESTVTSLPERQQVSSSTLPTQPSASASAKPRRIPFPISQPSTDRIPQRTTKSSPIIFTSTLPSGLSPTGKEFSMGGYGGGPAQVGSGLGPNAGRRTDSASGSGSSSGSGTGSAGGGGSGSGGAGGGGGGDRGGDRGGRGAFGHGRRPSESVESDLITADGQPKIKASRTFDPNTSVDVRRRDTQEVLTRFMRNTPGESGAGGAGGGAGGGGQGGGGKSESRA